MVYIETAEQNEIFIDEKEVRRYLGLGKTEPEPRVAEQIAAVADEVKQALSLRACFTFVTLKINGNTIDFGSFSAQSASLSKNLKGCGRAVFLAATAGMGVDRIIAKYSRLSPSSAVMAEAAGAAAVEAWCDALADRISAPLNARGLYLRPRFSPGYGDFALSHQRDMFRVLDCAKHIGLTMTESFMMAPSKSVTALSGLTAENSGCSKSGCETCEKRNTCDYTRG